MEQKAVENMLQKHLPDTCWNHIKIDGENYSVFNINLDFGEWGQVFYWPNGNDIKVAIHSVETHSNSERHKVLWNGELPPNQERDDFDYDFLGTLIRNRDKVKFT